MKEHKHCACGCHEHDEHMHDCACGHEHEHDCPCGHDHEHAHDCACGHDHGGEGQINKELPRLLAALALFALGMLLPLSGVGKTTLLVLCVMPTAVMELRGRIKDGALRRGVSFAMTTFAALMVLCRFLSGVHWCSDIVGGALLSAGLVELYRYMCGGTDGRI